MPVKKKPAAKKATARKTAPAKRTTAKKSAPAKKTAAKKTASSDGPDFDVIVAALVKHIENGNLDGHLSTIDAAMTERINNHQAVGKGKPKDTGSTRKVSDPPKRSVKREASAGKLEKNKTYKIKSNIKKLGGARVKFLRSSQKDNSKAVVEMIDGKPGFPKGKQVMVLAAGLTEPK